jgi:hypothetical protein
LKRGGKNLGRVGVEFWAALGGSLGGGRRKKTKKEKKRERGARVGQAAWAQHAWADVAVRPGSAREDRDVFVLSTTHARAADGRRRASGQGSPASGGGRRRTPAGGGGSRASRRGSVVSSLAAAAPPGVLCLQHLPDNGDGGGSGGPGQWEKCVLGRADGGE